MKWRVRTKMFNIGEVLEIPKNFVVLGIERRNILRDKIMEDGYVLIYLEEEITKGGFY